MKPHFFTACLTVLALTWVSGCATQADLQAEQRERDALRAQLADSKASTETVRREIEKIRGDVEELRYRLDRLAKARPANAPQVQTLEDRIAALERQLAAKREEPPPPPPPQPAPPSPSLAPASPEIPQTAAVTPPPLLPPPVLSLPIDDEIALAKEPPEVQEEYRVAWQALHDQQYEKAVQQFRAFQRKNPTSEMADDAQYWIGESYFTRRDYNRAILEFNDVLKYRKGDKVPAALLRQAQAFVEIGDKTDARLILQKLVNDYPNSKQAKDARERLQNLGR